VPELPEVETVRRSLEFRLAGRLIEKVDIRRASAVAHPTLAGFSQGLVGQQFTAPQRRGKYLLLGLAAGGWLGVHLRMSGRLILRDPPLTEDLAHLRVILHLVGGGRLYFQDPRTFGRLWYIRPDETPARVIPTLARLGPEPADLELTYFQSALARRSIAIKTALLDQALVAGIGNIYADESLFQAGIHPLTPANQLDPARLTKLIQSIQQVLNQAILAGGTTLRDYADSQGQPGNYQTRLQVYGRYQQACLQCGNPIHRLRLGGRSSHFCLTCQT